MRQLRRHRLEHDPGGHDPGEQEGDRVGAPLAPAEGQAEGREGRARPEGREEDEQIGAGRRPVLLLGAPDLAEHVLADRLAEEGAAALPRDGEEPGRHQDEDQGEAEPGAQRQEPAPGAGAQGEGDPREPDEERHHRALDQDAERQSEPEGQDRREGEPRIGPPEPGAGERPHGGDRAGGEHRVGLGEARLGREHQAGPEQGGGQQRPPARQEGERRPIGQQHGRDRARQRGQPVEGDPAAGLRHAERLAQGDAGALEPVDPHRLLVPGLPLEADIDEIARLQHLLGGLGEARLVPVHGLEGRDPGQEADEAEDEKERAGAGMARGGRREEAVDPGGGVARSDPAGGEARHGVRRPCGRS
ncbi:hypothetical protein AEGHOMDF_1505 [Methylobacterium soli]|nr:hypothetical protein AEGHOMDF_1505 [Methylobacterium soli]